MKKVILLAAVFLASEVYANNYFIPNHYRSRRTLNQFSAIGWSHRNEASLEYSKTESETKEDGEKIEEATESEYGPLAFYRLNENFNFEFQFLRSHENEEEVLTSTEESQKADTVRVSLGYQPSTSSMAFGYSYSKSYAEEALDTLLNNFGVGYRLENDYYLGAGYQNIHGSRTSHIYTVGLGKVWGDSKKPDSTAEGYYSWLNQDGMKQSSLGLRGLWNRDAFQYYGDILVMQFDLGNVQYDMPTIRAGLDYQFSDYYVAPEVIWSALNSDDMADQDSMVLSLEGGYRAHEIEIFLRYNNSDSTQKARLTQPKEETAGRTFAVGFTKFFE